MLRAKDGEERFNKSGPVLRPMLRARLMPSPCLADERMIMRTNWREEGGKGKCKNNTSRASVYFFVCHAVFLPQD